MSGFLVPVDPSNIAAVYNPATDELKLSAKGEVPEIWFEPYFEKELFVGGLLYSIRDHAGGVGPEIKGPPPQKPFEISTTLHITLPEAHFNSATVSVEVANGTFPIPIRYLGLKEQPTELAAAPKTGNADAGTRHAHVLDPIKKKVLATEPFQLKAQTPLPLGLSQAFVKIRFDTTILKLASAEHEAGHIVWTIDWLKQLPDGKTYTKVDVITTNWNGLHGDESKITKTIQPYQIIPFVL